MDDVSWRRILEQADSRQPFGRNPNAAPSSARVYQPEPPSQKNVDWSSLEAELANATHENGPPATSSHARPARQRRPSPGQHARQLMMRMEHASSEGTLQPQPQSSTEAKNKPSGLRNLVAISLSLAVVGYAAYQLRETMPESDGEVTTAQHVSTSTLAESEASDDQPQIRVSGNRLDLRPSLASQSNAAGEGLSEAKARETTASINTANASAILPQEDGIKPDLDKNETLILSRGHDILGRGHVSGARLIFEYLADRGSARGAYALAQTYDVKYISQHNLPADAADETMASKWYQQAAALKDAAGAEAR